MGEGATSRRCSRDLVEHVVARRDDAAQVLAASGLQVMDSGPYLNFRHRVDQAILRDILVARKA